MNGSMNLTDRTYLIENVDKLIFNSMWSRDRFFLDLNNGLIKKHFCRKGLMYIFNDNYINFLKEIFLDTETTGLSFKDGHRIVEIACIETEGLIPTKNIFHKLINPKRNVTIDISRIVKFIEVA